MGVLSVFLCVVVFLGVIGVGLAVRRFVTLRSTGATVVLRRLPARRIHGWRHGLIRYDGDLLHYYKLRSIAPGPDSSFHRTEITLGKRRELTPSEAAFMAEGSRVLEFRSGRADWEIALTPRAEMAFTAWLESAPDVRQERPDYRRLRERIAQVRKKRRR
ncbi:hypothetical protein CATYP_06350 [Corynebacterium atypicum]|uniref:DUF2550 domain-containing protein n=1 Tax=Corynebacterium atypicum TaxID=191610 RepID=A0ABM5QN81_9CORY|nr:DUF2550 domain-containing protein [Corynebacterium atypicum]AIG64290.1 hypothetical protein CATYP_06350 [Corynebacterium atypicum]